MNEIEKYFLNDDSKLHKFGRKYKPTDSRNWVICRQNKPKGIHAKALYSETSENDWQRKTLERSQRSDALLIRKKQLQDSGFLIRKHDDQRKHHNIFQELNKKNH